MKVKLNLIGLLPTTVGYKTPKTTSKSDHPFNRNTSSRELQTVDQYY